MVKIFYSFKRSNTLNLRFQAPKFLYVIRQLIWNNLNTWIVNKYLKNLIVIHR